MSGGGGLTLLLPSRISASHGATPAAELALEPLPSLAVAPVCLQPQSRLADQNDGYVRLSSVHAIALRADEETSQETANLNPPRLVPMRPGSTSIGRNSRQTLLATLHSRPFQRDLAAVPDAQRADQWQR